MVYARSLACGCLAGVGMAFFGCASAACELIYGVHIRYFNRVLHLRARTRYTTSNNPARLWPMTSPAFSCPYWQSLHREKAACVECHEVNKCTSHPKQKTEYGQPTLHFPEGLSFFMFFFVWVFYLTEWLFANSADPLGSRRTKVLVLGWFADIYAIEPMPISVYRLLIGKTLCSNMQRNACFRQVFKFRVSNLRIGCQLQISSL